MQLVQCTMCEITGWKIQPKMYVMLKCDLLVCHRREKERHFAWRSDEMC